MGSPEGVWLTHMLRGRQGVQQDPKGVRGQGPYEGETPPTKTFQGCVHLSNSCSFLPGRLLCPFEHPCPSPSPEEDTCSSRGLPTPASPPQAFLLALGSVAKVLGRRLLSGT